MNVKTIIFIGRSGCGKGTQVEKITEHLKENDNKEVFHLEAGQRFRNFINEGTYSSFLAKRVSEEGGLQPEFLSVWAWTGELINNLDKHTHLMIDGTPRRKDEALILGSALSFYERTDIDIVYINVSREWATNRMHERGRADDIEDSDIKNRLDWFDDDVVPVLDYYRAHKSYNFHEINGEQEIEKVYGDILKSLDL
jgi:adenylate kinase family enzyme